MEKITSRKNPLVVHLKRLGQERRYRRECGEYVCCGKKLYEEAVKWGAQIKAVISWEECFVPEGAVSAIVPEDLLRSVSPLSTPPDILFSCAIPENKGGLGEKCIILENLQDPGNVGTILRTANAFKIDSVILTGGCADLYNIKTVRAAMGALFRQRVFEAEEDELLKLLKKENIPLYCADIGEGCVRIEEGCFPQKLAVVIGNEGNGISEKLKAACDVRFTIPMEEKCESLNAAVAASIVMWEIYK